MIQETAREWAVYNFSSGCEVADMLAQRLDFGPDVRDALRFTFERWNGNGYPAHAQGEAIPLPMRVVHLSHDMEAIGRLFSPEQALEAARDRRDRTYDPALADLFVDARRRLVRAARRDRAVGRRARARARAPPHARPAPSSTTRSPSSPTSSTSSRRTWAGTAAAARSSRPTRRGVLGLDDGDVADAPPRGARARLRHHRRAELDLGQARPAHAGRVRPGRAPPDADRADAAPLAGVWPS